jgi:hypothetical protein
MSLGLGMSLMTVSHQLLTCEVKLSCAYLPWRCIGEWLCLWITWGEWSASRLCRFIPGDRAPGTHRIGRWVDPRAGLDHTEKYKFLILPGLQSRALGCPASSQPLYWLLLWLVLLKVRFSGSTGGQMGQRWHPISRQILFVYGKGNENHELGTGLFVHKGIIPTVERVEFVSDININIILLILMIVWLF